MNMEDCFILVQSEIEVGIIDDCYKLAQVATTRILKKRISAISMVDNIRKLISEINCDNRNTGKRDQLIQRYT